MFVKKYSRIVDLDFATDNHKLLREFKKKYNLIEATTSYIETTYWKKFMKFVELKRKMQKKSFVNIEQHV